MVSLGQNFEREQKNLIINHWRLCKEISLIQLLNQICERCSKYPNLPTELLPNLDQVNPFSAYNNMDPGEQPEELSGLTLME